MAYKFLPNMMYRMPTHFGPALGPRQGEGGRKFLSPHSHRTTTWSVDFLTNKEQLEDLLPDGFEVGEEPVVTIMVGFLKEVEWLAGRGYNVLGVTFPAIFNGKKDRAVGRFMPVLWENLYDPIITGRDELGFSKIYSEIPEPRIYNGEAHFTASWLGFKFVDVKIWNLKQLSPNEVTEAASQPTDDGLLHYKYIPKTGVWGTPDVAYVTLTPSEDPQKVIKEIWCGQGKVQFHKATWEDLPTLFNIVNTLYDLEIKEYREATMIKSVGNKDISDQRILY